MYIFVYMRSSYQEDPGIPITCIILPHFSACPKPGHGFPTSYVMFVSVSSFKMRGHCLFC